MENLKSLAFMIESQAVHSPKLDKPLNLTANISNEQYTTQYQCANEEEAKTFLIQAVKKGALTTIRLLLAYQPDWIRLYTPSGLTLLHVAVQENHWPAVELLLQLGAKLFAQTKQGASLLHMAVPHPMLVEELIKRAPTLIEMRDNEGNTPLHYAAQQGQLKTIEILLKHKAWIEAKNKSRQTALHIAAMEDRKEVVTFLLRQEANYQALDKNEKLAEKLAKENNHFATAYVFVEHKEYLKQHKIVLEKHASVVGTLSKTQYYLMNEIYPSEVKDIYEQTGIEIKIESGKEYFSWPKQKGNFGQVGLARNAETGKFVAVKEITGEENIGAPLNEAKLQKHLEGQPNLMPLFDYAHDKTNKKIYQFMLYAEFGHGQFLKQRLNLLNQPELLLIQPMIKLKVLIYVAKSLLTAVQCVHDNKMIHSDIKPDNLLIDRYGRIYLSDYGCAHELTELSYDISGDIRFMAPEKIKMRLLPEATTPYNPKLADAWSVGISLLSIASFLNPEEDFHPKKIISEENLIKNKIASLECLNYPGLFQIIKGLVTFDVKKRLSIEAALKDELFQNPLYELTDAERITIFQQLKGTQSKLSPASMELIYAKSPGDLKEFYSPLPKDQEIVNPYVPITKSQISIPSPQVKHKSESINSYQESPSSQSEHLYQQARQALKNKNTDEAIELFEQAEKSGNLKAANELGFLFLSKNKPKAYQYLLKAAENNNTAAMISLAQMLEYGDGISKDEKAALTWYEKLAALGLGAKVVGKNRYGEEVTVQGKIEKLKTINEVKHIYV